MFGYAGKILRVNLTNQNISTIETEQYREWAGGHGLGAALFFDLVRDKTVSAFDPGNVLVIAPGLFSGTLVPAANRTELVGIQAQAYPWEWFSRSNVGGRFAAMLKYAGFDAIVLEGAASSPAWLRIVEGEAELRDATSLWGLGTYDAQKAVIKEMSRNMAPGGWTSTGNGASTMQRPAVLAIGPAGENKSRIAAIVTDAGNAFGQGGFGGVWGAKKLKAIGVLGTGGVKVADPKGLMETRLWAQKTYGADPDCPRIESWLEPVASHFGGHPSQAWTPFDKQRRRSGCYGCHLNCKSRTSTGLGNEALCVASTFYQRWDRARHGQITEISGKASNLAHQLGINAFEMILEISYLKALHDRGLLGPGKKIDADLDMDRIGEADFIEDFLNKIAFRKGIGDDLAEGLPRAAQKWGRLEEDLRSGLLGLMCWGYPGHYDVRAEAYWGYASIVADRDINCHDFNILAFLMPNFDIPFGKKPLVSAEEAARWIGEIGPYHDPLMIDFSTSNMYSSHMARTTAWLLHYSRFWKQSCGLCDNAFSDFINPYGPGNRGLTPEGELRFYRAVTGDNLSFDGSMEIGRRIFNLDKAVWTLQGRRRDMEKLPDYYYLIDSAGAYIPGKPRAYYMPTVENGVWDYRNVVPRRLDKDKVEQWKTLFYQLEGWDTRTGWQTRSVLEGLKLNKVADELENKGKLP